MALDFPVIIERKTLGVSERGFGTILIYDSEKERDYTIITPETLKDLEEDSRMKLIAEKLFMQSPAPAEVAVYGGATLDNIAANDFFFITSTSNSVETIKEISKFASINNKVYAVTVNDEETIKELYEEVNDNTFVFYHEDKDSFAAEALAVIMSYNVGSKTAKFKRLNGVKGSNISATLQKGLKDNNINMYTSKLGALQTSEGVMLSGEYIDVVLGEFWLRFQIEERIMHLALNNDKIPYTNRGIGMMVGVIESVLKEGVGRDIIMEGQYIIDYKRREEVSSNEVANRDFSHIRWGATLSGAIHTGDIYGNLTNDLLKEVS